MFCPKSRTNHYTIFTLVLLVLVLTPAAANASIQSINEVSQQVIWWMISSFFGFLVYLAGAALDISIDKFIVQFGGLFRTSGLGSAVNNLWTVVRDMFNLLFIFGLIYAGFNLIINSDEGGVKKAIANLVIAALLINFSLFITKTIIDFSNLAAVQVAQVLYSGAGQPPSISGAFLQNMGATGLFAPSGAGAAAAAAAPPPGWIYIFSAMFLLIVAAFAFAVGAVLIGIRFIMLNYYMVISPVMFLGRILPKFQSYTSQFWSDFLRNAFFAPAFLLMLYFSLYILGSMYNFLTVAGGGAARPALYDAFGTPQGSISGITTVIMFLMAAGFLIASVVLAKKMGAVGGDMAVSVGQDLRKRGQRMLGNAGRGIGRGLGGGAARWAGRRAENMSGALDKKLGALGQRNRFLRATARGLDNSVGAGLRSAQNASVFGSETAAAREKRIREHQSRFNKNANVGTREDTVAAEFARLLANSNNSNNYAQRTARADALNKLAAQVRRMSDDEVLGLDHNMLTNPAFAQLLTDAHITALKNSGKYTNDQTTAITKARDAGTFDTISVALDSRNATETELTASLEQLNQTVQRLSGDRLTGLSEDILKKPRVAMNLTDKQIDELKASGKFNAQQIATIETARNDAFTAVASGAAPLILAASNPNSGTVTNTMRESLFQRSAQSAGSLPAAVFKDRNMAKFITPTALQQRVRNGLSSTEITDIADNIRNNHLSTAPANVVAMWHRWSTNTTEGAQFNF